MKPSRTWLVLAMLLIAPTCAAEAAGEMSQLMQLNQASEQALWWMQQPPTPLPPTPTTAQQHYARELQRQQQVELRQLQEGQRRELLLRRQRATISGTPEAQRRLDAIHRQRQFQLQQGYQLNRFRSRLGPR
jgi:hypothetical protein